MKYSLLLRKNKYKKYKFKKKKHYTFSSYSKDVDEYDDFENNKLNNFIYYEKKDSIEEEYIRDIRTYPIFWVIFLIYCIILLYMS